MRRLVLLLTVAGAGAAEDSNPYRPPAPTVRLTSAELGAVLFFDPALSRNGKVSCATCHDPLHGYGSVGLPVGVAGVTLSRRAPTVLDRGGAGVFFWDGRASSLAEQAAGPLTHPDEMGNETVTEATARINRKYALRLTDEDLLSAVADFERTLRSPPNKYDRYLIGKEPAFTPAEERGLAVFRGKGECTSCHKGRLLTDDDFHATGAGALPDHGRYNVTKNKTDVGKFKTPGLRQVRLTGPYMHDGSLKTLRDVIGFYNRGGRAVPNRSKHVKPLKLTDREIDDLLIFLESL